jgi:hypothetical protein
MVNDHNIIEQHVNFKIYHISELYKWLADHADEG